MAKGKLQRARDRAQAAGVAARNLAIASAAISAVLAAGGDAVLLEKLPVGFSSEEAGKGKPVWANRRVQVLGAATAGVALFAGKGLKSRVALVALAGLLGAAIRNHRRQYLDEIANTTEVYE